MVRDKLAINRPMFGGPTSRASKEPVKNYLAPTISKLGTLEVARSAPQITGEYSADGQRLRVRCQGGHYVLTNGDAAPSCSERPALMTIDAATRAIVLHRRLCEGKST